jgi:hypothetical protein
MQHLALKELNVNNSQSIGADRQLNHIKPLQGFRSESASLPPDSLGVIHI